jgi:hypothetical protein
VELEVGFEEVLVFTVEVEDFRVLEVFTLLELFEDDFGEFEQFPNSSLHPRPQYASERPQKPKGEQQLLSEQTNFRPSIHPHWPSLEMIPGIPSEGLVRHVPKSFWHPAPQKSKLSPLSSISGVTLTIKLH